MFISRPSIPCSKMKKVPSSLLLYIHIRALIQEQFNHLIPTIPIRFECKFMIIYIIKQDIRIWTEWADIFLGNPRVPWG